MTDLRQGVTPAGHRALDVLDANRPAMAALSIDDLFAATRGLAALGRHAAKESA